MMYGGSGSGSSFNIQDYAPIDPMSGLAGFPAGTSQPPPQQQQTSVSNSSRSGQPRSNQASTRAGIPSTEQMQRDFQRAAVYVPTPINENIAGVGNSSVQQQAHNPNRGQQQLRNQSSSVSQSQQGQRNDRSFEAINGQQRGTEFQGMPTPNFPLPNMPAAQTSRNVQQQQQRQQSQNVAAPNMAPYFLMRTPFNSQQPVPTQGNLQAVPQSPNFNRGQVGAQNIRADVQVQFLPKNHPQHRTHVEFNGQIRSVVEVVHHFQRTGQNMTVEFGIRLRSLLPPDHQLHVTAEGARLELEKAQATARNTISSGQNQPAAVNRMQNFSLPPGIHHHLQPPLQALGNLSMTLVPQHQVSSSNNAPPMHMQMIQGAALPQGMSQGNQFFPAFSPEQMSHYLSLSHAEHQQRQQFLTQHRQLQHNLQQQQLQQHSNSLQTRQPASAPHQTNVQLSSSQAPNLLQRIINEDLDPTETVISADERPPPCPYSPTISPAPASSSNVTKEEPRDVKPILPLKEKRPKKKKPVVITLDDDEPRPVRVKQEPLDESAPSSSSETTVIPSTSSGTAETIRIKQEPVSDVVSGEKTQKEHIESAKQMSTVKQEVNDQTGPSYPDAPAEVTGSVPDNSKEQLERELAELKRQNEILRKQNEELDAKLQTNQSVQNAVISNEDAKSKLTVQESKVSTSQGEASRSRSSSVGSDVMTLRRKKHIVTTTDDDEDDEMPARKIRKPNSKQNVTKSIGRPRFRLELSDDEDDQETSYNRRSTARRTHPVKKRKAQFSDSSHEHSVESSGGYDSINDFIASDDEAIVYETDEEVSMSRTRKTTSRSSSRASSSKKKSQSKSPSSAKKTSDKRIVERRRDSEPSTSDRPKSFEDIEKQKKAKRQKISKTREENRERKRMAQLESMDSTVFVVGSRRTRGRDPIPEDPPSPLSEALEDTIAVFHETVPNRKKLAQNAKQPVEQRKKELITNKRPSSPDTVRDFDEGVHVPAKRMAHSNSAPNPSKPRPSASGSSRRPVQVDMMEKRYHESEQKRKAEKLEYELLKSKKFRTQQEQFRMDKLRLTLKSKDSTTSNVPSTSRPSTSAGLKKVVVKTEPISSPVKSKPPPPVPSILEPTKGRTFLSLRKKAVEQIFKTLLDKNSPNAASEAQKIELEIVTKHPVESKYKVSIAHKTFALRKSCSSGIWEINKNVVSHDQILAGGPKENCSVARGRRAHVNHRQLSMEQLHPLILPFKLTDAELESNAYPLIDPTSKVAKIAETTYTVNKKMFLEDHDLSRTCSRCNKEFRLNPDGSMIRQKDICRYHNRGVARNGKRDTFRKRYPCCNEEYNVAPGCKFSDVHVFDQLFKKELATFVATPLPTSPDDSRSKKAYALDCEMVYTVAGPALARLTMVDMQDNQVLDVFIKPPTEVLDPNTEFSGLTMEQIENAKDTMQSCHKKLFNLINSETILIGHSLESDLKAMRIVHKSVIDTAILFRSTGDFKIALRHLSTKFLGKTIQGDNEDALGHDSLEDARTCVDLIYYGLKNPEAIGIRPS